MEGGGLKPVGGYKGYGLATMVEVFCGILSGGPFATHIRLWSDSQNDKPANLVCKVYIQTKHTLYFYL